jgi:hypothetical protein
MPSRNWSEMNAAFCCASLGIVPTVRHADYIGSWLEVLREDNRAIVRAASHASKAADYILGFLPERRSVQRRLSGLERADGGIIIPELRRIYVQMLSPAGAHHLPALSSSVRSRDVLARAPDQQSLATPSWIPSPHRRWTLHAPSAMGVERDVLF